ncbi:N-formylglutamate amidohydrolase [Legionella hackeliae]|uniref:N-formylglutamate amidohydrolase n=1 Tax=Legionella hackeliae TaxID=449 RepID=A0A0A8UQY0_LEGHA|nr:N-formylglutamate amidohydrolase [Legionella hackeliae]KTD14872.1 N-formylglutamate amidohydrolase [Legionella hackeliae]CEK09502.1 N-formylglutamate amidohydrolase [Legionella hackeliae]STX49409.1 N-formylglutamate amidohydrolase [Legionella hackeliae]
MKPCVLVLSCEHAVNSVPITYQKYFNGHEALLNTHRGIDFGALGVANYFKQSFNCDLVQANATRLLIDCNRRLSNPACFSEITAGLSQLEKQAIIEEYYTPFRENVINIISNYINLGYQVWHFSIHSFTPVMNDLARNADIGFLYDPKRIKEKALAKAWKLALKTQSGRLRVRLNYPYRGITDGFTSFLRTQFDEETYLGLEVENNQALMTNSQSVTQVAEALASALHSILP